MKIGIEKLKEEANNGNIYAMRELGYLYRCGEGVERDMEKCYYWTKKPVLLLILMPISI